MDIFVFDFRLDSLIKQVMLLDLFLLHHGDSILSLLQYRPVEPTFQLAFVVVRCPQSRQYTLLILSLTLKHSYLYSLIAELIDRVAIDNFFIVLLFAVIDL